jgi:GT2 family glycosyltransferase
MALSASKPVATPQLLSASGAERGDVSVVICTKDRPADLVKAITSIRECGDSGHIVEIVVVEEGDSPRQLPGVRHVRLPREGRGFGYARNMGVRVSRGNLLLFMDDDCEAEQGWIEALIAPFARDPQVLGVAGAVLVRDCGSIGYAENILGFPGGGLRYWHQARGKVVPIRYLSTCNCAYRRDALLHAGGFAEGARLGGEDFLLAEKVSALGPCVYAPDAVVYHRPRGRLCAVFRWFMRRGKSEITLLASAKAQGGFLQFLLRSSWTLRLLLLLGLLAAWPRTAVFLPPAVILYYGVMLWRFRFAPLYPHHRRAWWLVPFVKLTMDLGTEVGRWRAMLSWKRL